MITLYYHAIILSALFSLFLGSYVLFSHKSSYLNRSFFRLAIILFFISTSTYFAVTTKTALSSSSILTYSSLFWFLFPIVFIKFILALTGRRRNFIDKLITVSFVFPLLLYLITLFSGSLFSPFKSTPFGWSYLFNNSSLLLISILIYYFLFISGSLIILFFWGNRNKNSIRYSQSNIILFSTLVISFLLLVYRPLIKYFWGVYPPSLFPVFLNIWLGALAYAIFRFHLMLNIPLGIKNLILSHIEDLIIIHDEEGTITYINKRVEQLTGYNSNEILDNGITLLLPILPQANSVPVESILETKTGSTIPIRLSRNSFQDSKGYILSYIITASDIRIMKTLQNQINQKEKAMLQLKESEKKFSKVFTASPAGLIFFHVNKGLVLEINNSALVIAGYTKEELSHLNQFLKRILVNNSANRLLVHDIINKHIVTNRICKIRTKNNTIKTLLISAENLNLDKEPCLLIACSDITEVEKIKQQLLRKQKMESLGELAGGIAHDFNNMLTVINGNISLALADIKDKEIRSTLFDSLKASKNASLLTSQLLSFSRGKDSDRTLLDFHKIISCSASIAFSGKSNNYNFYPDAESFMVNGNKNQLQQIFINLFINALQASKKDGEITVSTRNDSTGRNIITSVTDFGNGIPAKNIETIFDPFFTTKEKGTGLGLSIVYSIVQNHSGTITVTSSKETGTIFTLIFPIK